MQVVVLETPPLGDRSYLVHDGEVALVIDPQRDIDRVDAAATAGGVRITHIAETHIHNDYLTGGLLLARQHDAAYLINAADEVSYERTLVEPRQTITVGRLEVEVVATPGHTDTHLSYVVRDGADEAVFSGGSLLYGSVGRTDLLGAHRAADLAAQQHASVRRLATHASSAAALYPTHGFGGFCSAGPAAGVNRSTLGREQARNHALLDDDVEHFVSELLAGLTTYPTYYAHMGAANQRGPGPADLTVPAALTSDDLRKRLDAGEWVVDVRNRVAFASSHLVGTTSFEYGDGGSFTGYLGWVIPYGVGLTLIGDLDDVRSAIRDLSRIGFDRPEVVLCGDVADIRPVLPTSAYPRWDWPEAHARRAAEDFVLDVRRTDEYTAGHVDGAINMPMHDVQTRMPELPRTRRVIVYCASGYRSGVVASLLDRSGIDVVHVDDDYENSATE